MDILNPVDSQKFFNLPSVYKIVLFYASWCPHCTQVAPVIRKLNCLNSNPSNQIKIALVEQKSNQTLASLFGVQIQGFPTIYLFKDGSKRDISSLRTLPQLTQFISQSLNIKFTEEEKICLMQNEKLTANSGGSTFIEKNVNKPIEKKNIVKGHVSAGKNYQPIANNFFYMHGSKPVPTTFNKNPCPFNHQPNDPPQIKKAAGGKIIITEKKESVQQNEQSEPVKNGGQTDLKKNSNKEEEKIGKGSMEPCVIS